MFKKDTFFPRSITPGAKSKVKSSVQRAIRTKITETYPLLTPHIDEIIPKKSQLDVLKLPDRVTLYTLASTPLFYQHMDDPLIPHLRLIHAFPACFPTIRIDRGAIRFVLSGATLMAPGLTSPGGRLPNDGKGDGGGGGIGDGEREFEKGEVVAVAAEGKVEVCMVGVLSMGTKEVRELGKGVVVEGGHFLGDGLWRLEVG
ncbi:MAG: translation machinery-associated protein 20 [Candelina mexicana]|nr:MAG: translation machinery-associated protein 20 [Candelina mexicana]